MLNNYQQSTLGESSFVLLFLAALSAVYWFKSRSIVKSSHGLILIFGYLYAVLISAHTEIGAHVTYYWPLWVLLIVGLVVAGFSCTLFNGRRWVHLIHIFTLASAAWLLFVGSMAIGHDWL